MKVRLKPAEVEAVQFDPELTPWPKGVVYRAHHQIEGWCTVTYPQAASGMWGSGTFSVLTDAGRLNFNPGDWLILHEHGEPEPMTEARFREHYEPVTQPDVVPKLIEAARSADWGQVIANGGPPCFHLMPEGDLCLRAKRWQGHGTGQHHVYKPLDRLLVEGLPASILDSVLLALRTRRMSLAKLSKDEALAELDDIIAMFESW